MVSRWGAGGFPRKLVGIAFRENHQPIPMDPVVPPMDGSMGNHGLKMNIPKFCKQAEYAVYIYICIGFHLNGEQYTKIDDQYLVSAGYPI